MTKFTKMILLVTMLGVVTISCKKDGEDPTPQKTNVFTIDGTEYSLSAGFTEEYGGSETTGYNFDLTVHSSGLSYSEEDGITGQGDGLYFELWSTSATGLASGTYTVANNEAPNTFTDSNIYINVNADVFPPTADVIAEATSGSVTVSVNGSTYSINFDLTISGGQKLTGNYTGVLPNY